jgi:hypothetical protein
MTDHDKHRSPPAAILLIARAGKSAMSTDTWRYSLLWPRQRTSAVRLRATHPAADVSPMTATMISTRIVKDPARPGPSIDFDAEPMTCDQLWEAHASETGRAYCPRCGSVARWPNDPRAEEVSRTGRRDGRDAQENRPQGRDDRAQGRATGQREVFT